MRLRMRLGQYPTNPVTDPDIRNYYYPDIRPNNPLINLAFLVRLLSSCSCFANLLPQSSTPHLNLAAPAAPFSSHGGLTAPPGRPSSSSCAAPVAPFSSNGLTAPPRRPSSSSSHRAAPPPLLLLLGRPADPPPPLLTAPPRRPSSSSSSRPPLLSSSPGRRHGGTARVRTKASRLVISDRMVLNCAILRLHVLTHKHHHPSLAMLSRRLAPAAAAAIAAVKLLSTSASAAAGSEGRGETLGKRLLKLIYPKRRATVVLRKWADEGRTVQKYQLNRVVRELRKYGRFKHALEICEWMTTQSDMKLLPGDYAVHLDLVAKIRGLASAEKFFEDLPERVKGPSTCNALLHTYVQNNLTDKAEALVKEMTKEGYITCPLPFNHMISLYMSNGELERVPETIMELRRYTVPDVVTYNMCLTYCSKKDSVKGAEKAFDLMKDEKVAPDWMTFSLLASIYIKAGFHVKAREALVEMEKRASRKERAVFSSLLTMYASISDRGNLDRVWSKMRGTFRKFSDAEYKCMLTCLTRFGDIAAAESVYREWESVSGTRDSRLPNTILSFYIKNNMMETAESFLNRIVQNRVKPSYSTWELFIWGYLGKERMDKVLDCLKKALSSLEKWEPNPQLAGAIFSQIENTGNIEVAEQLLVMLRDAGYVTTEMYNSILRTYARAERMPLIIDERMNQDKVSMDEETRRLLRLTSQYPIGEVSTLIS